VQLTQKKQVLRTEGKQEGEQLDNKYEKAAVGEQRHEEDHDSDLPQHTNNSQARQVMLCMDLVASWRISQYKCSKGLTCKNDRMMYAGG
jgi:hypothetical protein